MSVFYFKHGDQYFKFDPQLAVRELNQREIEHLDIDNIPLMKTIVDKGDLCIDLGFNKFFRTGLQVEEVEVKKKDSLTFDEIMLVNGIDEMDLVLSLNDVKK